MAKKTTNLELTEIVELIRDNFISLEKAKRLAPDEYHKAILSLDRKDAIVLMQATGWLLISITTAVTGRELLPKSKSPHK